MSDGRTDAVTSAPSRVRGASERPRRGHGPMDALPVLARSHCVRLSLPLRLPLARWIVDSDPFLDAVFRMNRRAGEDAFRPLLASVLGVRPPQAPLSQPPRRDGAWPQHEVIIGAADGQNNSSVLTCLKNRNAGMLLVVMVVARRVRTLSLSSSLNNYSLRLQDTAIHKPIMRISSCL